MQHNFKISDLDQVYKYFIDEEIDKDYLNSLKSEYNEFRIKYNDSPKGHNAIDFLNELEGNSDHYQILLVGIKNDVEEVLCYYFVGEDYGDNDKERQQALKDFEEIKKYKAD